MLGKITSKSNGIKYKIYEQETMRNLRLNLRPPFGNIDAHYTKWCAKSKTSDFPSINLIILFPSYLEKSNHEKNKENFRDTLLSAFKQALFYDKITEDNAEIPESEDKLNELLKKSYEERKGIVIKFKNELIYQFVIDTNGQNLLEFRLKETDNFEVFSFEYNKSKDFESDIIKTVKLEILEELYKECKQGLPQKDIIKIVYFDESEINKGLDELTVNRYVSKKDENFLITENGENKRTELQIELERQVQEKRHIGFV